MAAPRLAVAFFLLAFCPIPAESFSDRDRALDDPPGQGFLFPADIEVDSQGAVFVLDSGRRSVFVYSSDGRFVREISGKGAWKDPQGIGLMPDRVVLLADGDAGRVIELNLDGTVRREYALGKGARVTDAAFYGDLVYCVDNRNARVTVFKRNGEKAGGWGKPGEAPSEFSSPFRLAIDPSGRVFVTDVMNSRIQWFSPHGQLLGAIRTFGAGRGKLFRPSSVSIDGTGGVWVGDSYTGLVQQFDDQGNARQILQSEKGVPEIFGDPAGIARVPGGIWVADQRKRRVSFQKQQVTGGNR